MMTRRVERPTEPDTEVGTKQLTILLQADLIDQAKREAKRLSVNGLRLTPTSVLRMAMTRGMPSVMEDGAAAGGKVVDSRKQAEKRRQQTLFLRVDLIDQAKKEARRLSVDGLEVTYMTVLRIALACGMPLVEEEGLANGSPKKR
jgi:hypothetical protein